MIGFAAVVVCSAFAVGIGVGVGGLGSARGSVERRGWRVGSGFEIVVVVVVVAVGNDVLPAAPLGLRLVDPAPALVLGQRSELGSEPAGAAVAVVERAGSAEPGTAAVAVIAAAAGSPAAVTPVVDEEGGSNSGSG